VRRASYEKAGDYVGIKQRALGPASRAGLLVEVDAVRVIRENTPPGIVIAPHLSAGRTAIDQTRIREGNVGASSAFCRRRCSGNAELDCIRGQIRGSRIQYGD